MNSMKILQINSSGFEEGGVENGLVLLKPVLERRGHEIRVVSSDTRPDLPRFNAYSFKNITSGRFAKYLYNFFNPRSYFEVRKILAEYKPDIVELHSMGQVSPSVLFLLRGYRTIQFAHGPESFIKALLPWYLPASDYKLGIGYDIKNLRIIGRLRYWYFLFLTRPLYRLGLRNIDLIIAVSSYMKELLRREGVDSITVPNATKLFTYEPLSRDTIRHTLGFGGRLE